MKKTGMLFVLLLLIAANVAAQEKNVEIFDINRGTVVMITPVDWEVQKEVEGYLAGITSLYKGVRPIPEQGFMIKVPLEPSVKIENEWLHDLVSQAVLIFPKGERPYVMVFDDENKMYFFYFKGSTRELLNHLNFHLEPL
ncbi:MAG: hypothetical protein ACE3JP_11655 [Ectobacillus sp.]